VRTIEIGFVREIVTSRISLIATVLKPVRFTRLPWQSGREGSEQVAKDVGDDHVVVDGDHETHQQHRPSDAFNTHSQPHTKNSPAVANIAESRSTVFPEFQLRQG